MIFNSWIYLFFLTITFLSYFLISKKNYKYFIIFISSSIFYGSWSFKFLFLIYFSIIFNYFIGIQIEKIKNKKIYFYLGVSINIFLLFYFKYLNFFLDNIISFLEILNLDIKVTTLKIILPLAISFYTFENISYLADVRRGFIKAEKNIFFYSAFIIFFPKLIAGPILRASEILPQFKKLKINLNLENIKKGLWRIILGLFLKVVFADNIGLFVDKAFLLDSKDLSGIDIITISFMFGFQIYFDFCAYTSIAIGSASLFNIHLVENFNFPYLSTTPREFWKRWHITLSNWIRDYVYLPLSKVKFKKRLSSSKPFDVDEHVSKYSINFFPLFITWLLVGIWHGSSWNFVFWGFYHFILLLIYRLIASNISFSFIPPKLKKFLNWIIILPLIMLSWIPFRSFDLFHTMDLYKRLFDYENFFQLNMRENNYIFIFFIFISHLATYFIIKKKIYNPSYMMKCVILSVMIYLIILFLEGDNKFIYFQF